MRDHERPWHMPSTKSSNAVMEEIIHADLAPHQEK
jgi:hypothetical protein